MDAVIQIEGVSKRYGDIHALDHMTMRVKKGEIFGIVGPNGAGKTTLIEIVEGLRSADEGEVHVLGFNIRQDSKQIKQRIGVLLQSTSVPERAKVKEILSLFASLYDQALDPLHIGKFLGLEDKMNVMFKSLSGGWKQRVSLALALINDPEIVFLDEPSMGLDPNARLDMWQMIKQLRDEGRTIVVTTHYMEEAETLCDRVALIDRGQLIALDTPKQLIRQLGEERFVVFENDGQNINDLQGLPYVSNVKAEPSNIRLATQDLDHTLKHLFRLADEQSWLIRNLKIEEGSMNDVFNQLTLRREGE